MLFLGGVTVLTNIAVYLCCYSYFGLPNLISNAIAWLVAVTVAFVTNKIWVFRSRDYHARIVIYEIFKFMSCRLVTGVIDMCIMYVGVDLLLEPASLVKICVNAVVIILNYLAGHFIVFHYKYRR